MPLFIFNTKADKIVYFLLHHNFPRTSKEKVHFLFVDFLKCKIDTRTWIRTIANFFEKNDIFRDKIKIQWQKNWLRFQRSLVMRLTDFKYSDLKIMFSFYATRATLLNSIYIKFEIRGAQTTDFLDCNHQAIFTIDYCACELVHTDILLLKPTFLWYVIP